MTLTNRKFNALIKMGASRFDVHVKDAAGNIVTFDIYHMTKDKRSHFLKEFKRAFAKSQR